MQRNKKVITFYDNFFLLYWQSTLEFYIVFTLVGSLTPPHL